MSSDNCHGNTSNTDYTEEASYDSSGYDADDRHSVTFGSEVDDTPYDQPGNYSFSGSRLTNFDGERSERMRGGCESCGGSASGKGGAQGRACGCSSSKCAGNCSRGCGSRSGQDDNCSQATRECREDPCSNEGSSRDPTYGNQSGCCSPAGCRPTCKKPARPCCSPCTSGPQGCGGGGCCGSGCRGGCGKPGRLCMPLRPCSTPPCKPRRGCRPPGSPCLAPRCNAPTPPCCKPPRIPVKTSCGAGGTSNRGSCGNSNYDSGDSSNCEAGETPNYATYGSCSYDAPSFHNYGTDDNCCCGATASENYGAGSDSSCGAGGSYSCGGSGSPRSRAKSPQRGGGCCSSPPQDDSGYGACGPKLPSGCECLGGGLDCQRCGRKVYQAEMQIASGVPYHNICFSCFCCRKPLEPLTYQENCGEIYCKQCYVRNFGPQGYGYGAGAGALQTPI